MKDGIELWYSEKSIWVSGGSGVTGHYTSMITPNNTYVGLGMFYSADGVYPSTLCGRFTSSQGEFDETMQSAVSDSVQTIEIKKTHLGDVMVKAEENSDDSDSLLVGQKKQYIVKRKVTEDFRNSYVRMMEGVTWSSSNTAVAVVDENGVVETKSAGSVTIKAETVDGNTGEVTLSVSDKSSQVTASPSPSPVVVKDKETASPAPSSSAGKANITASPSPSPSTGNKVTVSKVSGVRGSARKKKIVLRWNKLKDVTGYQVQISTNKNFTAAKTKVLSSDKSSCTIKKLTSSQMYYVRIRAYKKYKNDSGNVSKAYGKYAIIMRRTK
jgi:hypothetical protein